MEGRQRGGGNKEEGMRWKDREEGGTHREGEHTSRINLVLLLMLFETLPRFPQVAPFSISVCA